MAANPIGAVVVVVALLVGGIVALVSWLSRATDEEKVHKKALDDTIESTKSLEEQTRASSEAYQNNINEIESSIGVTEGLADKVFALAGEMQNLSGTEAENAHKKRELGVYIGALNESMDGLNVSYDEETGLLNTNREAIDNIIASRREEMEMAALMARASELTRERIDIELELEAVVLKRAESERLLADDTRALNRATEDWDDAQGELEQQLIDLEIPMQVLNEKIIEVEDSTISSGNSATVAGDQWVAANGQVMASQKEVDELNKEINKFIEEYVSAVTNMFDTIDNAARGSVDSAKANLLENIAVSEQFVSDLAFLMENGLDEAMIQNFERAGLDSAGEVRGLVESVEGLTKNELVASLEDLSETYNKALESGFEGAEATLHTVGEEAMDGYIAGIEENLSDVEQAGEAAGEEEALGLAKFWLVLITSGVPESEYRKHLEGQASILLSKRKIEMPKEEILTLQGGSNMNQLAIIDQRDILGKNFEMYGTFEEPLFLAKDVAEWIEYDVSNVSKLVNSVDGEEKTTCKISTSGSNYQTEAWFLTEDGLYEVLMQSRKPIARKFKKEVKKLLKALRIGDMQLVPTSSPEALRLAADLAEKNTTLQLETAQKDQIIGELKPKADYTDIILQNCKW